METAIALIKKAIDCQQSAVINLVLRGYPNDIEKAIKAAKEDETVKRLQNEIVKIRTLEVKPIIIK